MDDDDDNVMLVTKGDRCRECPERSELEFEQEPANNKLRIFFLFLRLLERVSVRDSERFSAWFGVSVNGGDSLSRSAFGRGPFFLILVISIN